MRHRSLFLILAAAATVGVIAVAAAAKVWAGDPVSGRWMASPRVVTPSGSPSPEPSKGCGGQWDCQWQQRFAAALALLNEQPGTLSAVVGDQKTGAVWRAGDTTSTTWTASTIKVAIVATLLEWHREGTLKLTTADRENMHAALHSSSNDATTALWNRYGGKDMYHHFRTRHHMTSLSVVPGYELFWRNLQCSADDLFRLMSQVMTASHVDDRAYLVAEMRDVASNQHWGVWAAGASLLPGNKNGWAQKPGPDGTRWVTHTVGFAGPAERYLVVVTYSQPTSGTLSTGVHTVSNLVATIFGVPVPAPVTLP